MGLQYATEENAGRIYVNLTGGAADLGAVSSPYDSHQYPSQQYHQQPHQQQQQQQHGGQNQQQDQIEQVVNAILPRVLRKLEKACCVVM